VKRLRLAEATISLSVCVLEDSLLSLVDLLLNTLLVYPFRDLDWIVLKGGEDEL